jgi:hypothetical protein
VDDSGESKARGVNPNRKSGVGLLRRYSGTPSHNSDRALSQCRECANITVGRGTRLLRRLVEHCNTFQQLLAALPPTVSVCLSVRPSQQRREGDSGRWAHQDFHIICLGLHLERLLQLRCCSVGTTQGAAVTSYKPNLVWCRVGR